MWTRCLQQIQEGVILINRGSEMLTKSWRASGKTKTFLSSRLGVSRPRLDYIFEHPDTATWEQAEVLSKELTLKVDDKRQIFLQTK